MRGSNKFNKDFKRVRHNPKFKPEEFEKIIEKLSAGKALDIKNRDHALQGEFNGQRECHVRPDILLVYTVVEDEKVIYLERIGSHSEIFG